MNFPRVNFELEMKDATNKYMAKYPMDILIFDDCFSMDIFFQVWGNSACGHKGYALQAFCKAYTVIISHIDRSDKWVYFNSKFAYHISKPNETFYTHLRDRNLVSVAEFELTNLYEKEDMKDEAGGNDFASLIDLISDKPKINLKERIYNWLSK
jgi:hypothetical protein